VSGLTRRNTLMLGAWLLAGGAERALGRSSTGAPVYISAASDSDDKHWVRGFTLDQGSVVPLFALPLPERGHHVAIHPSGRFLVAVARRPGSWMVLANAHTGEKWQTLSVPLDRHLQGHGIFTADGLRFITTESDFDDLTGDSGRVVVWDVLEANGRYSLARSREYPSYGVGPHELLLMPDLRTVVIANGGIRTHPSHDRDNLNIDSMLPSLAYIDLASGALLEQRYLPQEWHQASIRHMDVNAAGQIAMGMQFEGEQWRNAPLVATHQRGEPMRLLVAPEPLQGQMKQYVGSVRFSADGSSFGASCPRGNFITFWNVASGEMLGSVRSRDGCGLCATDTGFMFTSGIGRIAEYATGTDAIVDLEVPEGFRLLWDNHLSQVS